MHIAKQVSGATCLFGMAIIAFAVIRYHPHIAPAIILARWEQACKISRLCAPCLFGIVVFLSVRDQACIGFTKKQENQIKQTCYAQASQIRAVRKKMCDIITEEATKCDLKELVLKL